MKGVRSIGLFINLWSLTLENEIFSIINVNIIISPVILILFVHNPKSNKKARISKLSSSAYLAILKLSISIHMKTNNGKQIYFASI